MLSAVSRSYAIWTHRICPSLSRTPAIRRLSAAQSQHEIQNQIHTDGTLRSMPVRYTREEDEMILKHRREGLTFEAIAKLMKRDRGSVQGRFAKLSEAKYPPRGLFSDDEDQLLFERRMSGYSFKDIAEELGRSHRSIANRFHCIVAQRDIVYFKREIPRQAWQAWTLFSADDDSLIIERKAEGATGVQIARELQMESPNAHLAVNNRWRKLQLRRQTPLAVKPRVPVTAELARRIIESRAAGKNFREIAILERCSLDRVRDIFRRVKQDLDGKRTTLHDNLLNANSEQTRTQLNMKDRQHMTYKQDAQEVQPPQSRVHGLHRRPKPADSHRHMRRWTAEQDEQLLGFVMQNGRNWEALRVQMPDRTAGAIRTRYCNIMRDRAIFAGQKL